MLSFVFRRLAWAVVLAFVITLVTFVIFFVHAGRLDQRAARPAGFASRPADQYNLQGSLVHQYVSFLDRVVLHGRPRPIRLRSRKPVTRVDLAKRCRSPRRS